MYHHALDRAWAKVNSVADLSSKYDIHQLLSESDLQGAPAGAIAVLKGEYNTEDAGAWINKGTNDRQLKNTGVQTVAHWRTGGGLVQNEVEIGVRYHMDDVVRTHTEHPWDMVDMKVVKREGIDTTTVLDSHNSANALAVHLYDDFAIGNLRILPGIRHEHITTRTGTSETGPEDPQTQSIWLPGMGVYYTATDWLGVLASANEGFSPIPPEFRRHRRRNRMNYEAGIPPTLETQLS